MYKNVKHPTTLCGYDDVSFFSIKFYQHILN